MSDFARRMADAFPDENLDDLVLDLASHIASDINNGGLHRQIVWLLQHGVTEQEIAAALPGFPPGLPPVDLTTLDSRSPDWTVPSAGRGRVDALPRNLSGVRPDHRYAVRHSVPPPRRQADPPSERSPSKDPAALLARYRT
jgi:hypothetical protein